MQHAEIKNFMPTLLLWIMWSEIASVRAKYNTPKPQNTILTEFFWVASLTCLNLSDVVCSRSVCLFLDLKACLKPSKEPFCRTPGPLRYFPVLSAALIFTSKSLAKMFNSIQTYYWSLQNPSKTIFSYSDSPLTASLLTCQPVLNTFYVPCIDRVEC